MSKMNYADIDTVLTPWLRRHGLHLFPKYRDEDVRSIDVVDDAGGRYQIWISESDEPGKVKVSAWNYKNKRKTLESDVVDLEHVLEAAYSEVTGWIKEEGRTRTPA